MMRRRIAVLLSLECTNECAGVLGVVLFRFSATGSDGDHFLILIIISRHDHLSSPKLSRGLGLGFLFIRLAPLVQVEAGEAEVSARHWVRS